MTTFGHGYLPVGIGMTSVKKLAYDRIVGYCTEKLKVLNISGTKVLATFVISDLVKTLHLPKVLFN